MAAGALAGSLRRQDISSHDIDYVKYVGSGLTWERILSTCVISMWSNDIKCKYMFHVPPENLACKGLNTCHDWHTYWHLATRVQRLYPSDSQIMEHVYRS